MGSGPITERADIVDVEFETVRDRAAAPRDGGGRPSGPDTPGAGLGVFRASTRSPRRRPLPLPLFALIVALSACAAFYAAGGHVLFAPGGVP